MIETSQDLGELAKALSAAQSEIMAASKDRQNPFFNSTYATLASVWEACRGPLTKNGLSVAQLPVNDNARVGIVTTLMHASGQWMRSVLFATPEKQTPQALGSALTYCRRYALAAVVGVAPEDDDGDEASHGGKPAIKGNAQPARNVKADNNALMANATQVQQIHILKEKIGGWTGKADHDKHPYRAALLAYKKADGQPCTSSKDLTFEQASNLLKRMQGTFDAQATNLAKNEAQAPIAGGMNGEREPGEDDDDTGEVADAGLLQNVREAAVSVWGKKVKDLAPQWLQREFGVESAAALSKMQAERALQMLLKGETL